MDFTIPTGSDDHKGDPDEPAADRGSEPDGAAEAQADDPPTRAGEGDWLTVDSLADRDVPPEVIATLPYAHTGHDGGPCWPAEELGALLALAAREGK